MRTKRSEKFRMVLLNDLEEMASKVGKYLKLHGRQYIILATAASIIIAYSSAIVGCATSGEKPEYTGKQWQGQKFNGHPGGGQ